MRETGHEAGAKRTVNSKKDEARDAELRAAINTLEEEKRKLSRRRDKEITFGLTGILAGALILTLAAYYGLRTPYESPLTAIGISYGIIGAALGVIFISRQATVIAKQDVEHKLDLLAVVHQEPPIRAYASFRRHQLELRRYYNQTLTHGKIIFFVGIICLAGGFAIVAITLHLLTNSRNATAQILIGSVGAVGGLLSNFIAALYLRMFTTTTQSVATQLEQLTTTHRLHFANFLVSKVENKSLREEALSDMSKMLTGPLDRDQFLQTLPAVSVGIEPPPQAGDGQAPSSNQ
ncbi:hypothetical protein GCM10027074_77750 [Streptomyces deserti]